MNMRALPMFGLFLMPSFLLAAPSYVVTAQDIQTLVSFLLPGTYSGRSTGEVPTRACSGTFAFDGTTMSFHIDPPMKGAAALPNHFELAAGKNMRCFFQLGLFNCKTYPQPGPGQLNEQLIVKQEPHANAFLVSYSAYDGKNQLQAQCFHLIAQ